MLLAVLFLIVYNKNLPLSCLPLVSAFGRQRRADLGSVAHKWKSEDNLVEAVFTSLSSVIKHSPPTWHSKCSIHQAISLAHLLFPKQGLLMIFWVPSLARLAGPSEPVFTFP